MMTKNPLHPKWKVITNPVIYHLAEFLEYNGLQKPVVNKPLPDDLLASIEGRNDQLFHTLRLWGFFRHTALFESVVGCAAEGMKHLLCICNAKHIQIIAPAFAGRSSV
jgi:hypothetical protein